MKKSLIAIILLLIIIAVIIWFLICRGPGVKRPPTLLTNGSGVETTEFQIHETVLLDAVNLEPRTGYDIRIVRDDNAVVTELRLSTNGAGRIPETVIWYNVGVLPCRQIIRNVRMTEYNSNYDLTDYGFAGRGYTLSFIHAGNVVREVNFQVTAAMARPVLYACDAAGCPTSGFLIGEENVWVAGRNFPAGSIIRLWAVDADPEWQDGDDLDDRTKLYGYGLPMLFELKQNETGFKKLLWPKGLTSIGSYDIAAEVVSYDFGEYHASTTAEVTNVISNLTYSGFVVQRRPGTAEPLEVDIAGSLQSPFTFQNTFLTNEDVFVGVDPCLQPSYVGQTADIYIVPDKSDAQWTTSTGVLLNTLDVTGVIETITVGGICGNCWKTLAWSAPLTVGDYDVVLDFDRDGYYTPGVDLIDALDPVGFIVAEIRVDNISFNYSGSGAITIYDNVAGSNISAPEYYSANHIVKAAAWVRGGSHSIEVEFAAASSVGSAEIWAENGLGGLNSSGSPVTVTFSGGSGTGTFSVNSPPAVIDKNLFFWDWKYKNVGGGSTPTVDMGETGEHILYTTYATPGAPMTMPWLKVIDSACIWASGESNLTAARTAITTGVNDIGDTDGDADYNSANLYTGGSFSSWSFDLTDFLHDLSTMSNMQFNCADCANALQVYMNALGLGLEYRILDMGGATNYIDPIGNGNTANSTDPVEDWGTTSWNWHCVGWLTGDIIYDACLHLDGDGSPGSTPNTRLQPVNIGHTTYCNALTPATTPCTPDEQNVCTVY